LKKILIFIFLTSGISMASTPELKFILKATGAVTSSVLIGEEVVIKATGLTPNAEAKLRCGAGNSYSEEIFFTGSDGAFDTSKQAPLKGSYQGVDLDGPFWSRVADLSQPPTKTTDIFTCAVTLSDREVARSPFTRRHFNQDVTSVALKKSDVGFWGYYSKPAGKGPFPTLIILGGSEGGLELGLPPLFASMGYAALSIAYFQYEDLPVAIDRIPLEYFKKPIDWLRGQADVKTDKLSVYGISRGGELGLLLGSYFPEITAVVGVVPGAHVFAGYYDEASKKQTSSWTFHGQELTFVPFLDKMADTVTLPDGTIVLDIASIYRDTLSGASAMTKEAAEIKVEKINGPVLLLGGESDMIWTSCDNVRTSEARLKLHGHAYQDQFECFKDAGHALEFPGYPTTNLVFEHPVYKQRMTFGGTPAGTARAQRESWNQILNFLSLQQ
jgi:hypothetical protein